MKLFAFTLAFGAGAALAQTSKLKVKDAWARMPLVPQNNSAIYMVLENPGTTARSVVSVSTPDADRAELHETKMEGGMMKMMPAKEIAVPAKGSVELKEGGYNIMLFAVKKTLKPGDPLNVVLTLNDGTKVPVAATVRAGDAGRGGMPSGSGSSMPGIK
jgi:copper(I)-binding protein